MFSGLNIQGQGGAKQQQQQQKGGLEGAFPDWTAEALLFARRCLDLEQSRRPPATELINSSFFTHDNFHVTFPIQIKAKIKVITYSCGRRSGARARVSFTNHE